MAPLPFAWFGKALPYRDLYTAFGWISCAWLVLAAWFAYWFVKDVVGRAAEATVGAALYALAPASLFLNLSVDDAFLVVVLTPLAMLAIRRMSGRNMAACYVALSAVLAAIFFVSFLQGIAYALILFGTYSMWRGYRLPNWRVPAVFIVAVATGLLLAAPRLGTVFEDLRLLHRAAGFVAIHPLEILRLFHDGIFGDNAIQIARINGFFNPYEGIRLCVSGLATLLVLAMLVRSAEGAWFALVPARHGDLPFFFVFFVVVAGMLSVPPLQELLYHLFLNQYLLHGRFSIAALLPLCALVAALLHALLDAAWERLSPRQRATVFCGAVLAGGALALAVPWVAMQAVQLLGLPEAYRWGEPRHGFWPIATVPLITLVLQGALFIAFVLASWLGHPSPVRRALGAGLLGATMMFGAVLTAYDRVNGPQTRTGIPFQDIEFLSARADDFRLPNDHAVTALHERLEARDYRSVVIADPARFPGSVTPHVAQFWRLRLLEGYINGLPARMRALPWPEGVQGVRTIHFTSDSQLFWPLLSILNVKYAIHLNEALYFNRGEAGRDMQPDRLQVLRNPLPVAPRAFWVASAQPVENFAQAVGGLAKSMREPDPGASLARTSHIEGLGAVKHYASAGKIRASYEGDRVLVRLQAAPAPGFLVLNEMYHPAWHAYADGRELPVYATNLVMRGVEVPAGTRELEFRFVPFVTTLAAQGFALLGAALLAATVFVLVRRRATR